MDYEMALECEQALAELRLHFFKDDFDERIGAAFEVVENSIMPIIDNEKHKKRKQERRVSVVYNQFHPPAEVQRMVTVIMNGSNFHLTAQEEVSRRNTEVSDLVHAMEHVTDEDTLFELARDMQEVAQDRRIAKNFAELSKPLHEFRQKHPKAIEDLKKMHAEVNRIEQSIINRKYTPREKTAMQVAFESMMEKQKEEPL